MERSRADGELEVAAARGEDDRRRSRPAPTPAGRRRLCFTTSRTGNPPSSGGLREAGVAAGPRAMAYGPSMPALRSRRGGLGDAVRIRREVGGDRLRRMGRRRVDADDSRRRRSRGTSALSSACGDAGRGVDERIEVRIRRAALDRVELGASDSSKAVRSSVNGWTMRSQDSTPATGRVSARRAGRC